MRSPRRINLLAVFAALAVMTARSAIAQDETPPATPPAAVEAPTSTPPADETIEQRIDRLQAWLAKIDEAPAGRETERAAVATAIAQLKIVREERSTLADLRSRADAAPNAVVAARSELAGIPAADSNPLQLLDPPLGPDPTIEALEERVATATAAREANAAQAQQLAERLVQVEGRRTALPGDLVRLKSEREELEAEGGTLTDPTTETEVVAARREETKARLAATVAQLDRLEFEASSLDARQSALKVRHEVAVARLGLSDRVLKALQALVDRRRTEVTEAKRREAEALEARLANEHELVREVAGRNTERAREAEDVSKRTQTVNENRGRIEASRAEAEAALAQAEEQLDQLGLSEVYGRWMRLERSRLPAVRALRQQLAATEAALQDAYSKVFEYEGIELTEPTIEADTRIAAFESRTGTPFTPGRKTRLTEALIQTLESKNATTRQLVAQYRALMDGLLEQQRLQLEYVNTVAEYTAFIDERVLWIQSAPPLHEMSWRDYMDAFGWIVRPGGWGQVGRALTADMARAPLVFPVGALVILLGLILHRRFMRLLDHCAEQAANPLRGHFGHTFGALLLTILSAFPVPVAIGLVGWRIAVGGNGDEFPTAIASGLLWAASVLGVASLMVVTAQPNGLGVAHFGWPLGSMQLLRRLVRLGVPIIVPLLFIAGTLGDAPARLHDSLGRAALIASLVTATVLFSLALHPTRGIVAPLLKRQPQGWLSRLRYVWYGAALSLPIIIALAAAFGYLYTAERLSFDLRRTIWVILAVTILHALLVRAIADAQRRLSIEQWRKRRQTTARSDSGEAPLIPEDVLDVAAVSGQARSLLRMLSTVALVAGLAWVWSDKLPAFRALDEVKLWSVGVPGVIGDDGVPATTDVTLANIGIAMLVVLVTVLVVRNVPGLLEMTLLRRLPISAAGRYASTTVCRYLIVTVGVILTFNAIEIGWSHVQFLAAAITVGLGFGLQEIFANFVSGLILLFEQPVRVGDTVTVGSVNGTVSRIRMRATTIVDWDRKELVVPNKEFVTNQIINWTLTDGVLRLIIPVGIAYGSDTELARARLLQVARANANVLAEPEPRALFLGFGDNSLNFEVRVFLGSIEHLLETRHQLHMAIDAAFRKESITIAFPQRDLHLVSSVPVRVELVTE